MEKALQQAAGRESYSLFTGDCLSGIGRSRQSRKRIWPSVERWEFGLTIPCSTA